MLPGAPPVLAKEFFDAPSLHGFQIHFLQEVEVLDVTLVQVLLIKEPHLPRTGEDLIAWL
jgi:hypothetical protein